MTSKPVVIGVRGEYIYFDKIKGRNEKYRRVLTIFNNKRRYIREHRVLFELYHQCCLLHWGDVHHKNEKPKDNRKENLEGMMHHQHTILHNPRMDRTGRVCLMCGSSKTPLNLIGSAKWYRHEDGFICYNCWKRVMRSKGRYRS